MKEFCVDFNAPLCDYDSEEQTYGCRQTNPNICGSRNSEKLKKRLKRKMKNRFHRKCSRLYKNYG